MQRRTMIYAACAAGVLVLAGMLIGSAMSRVLNERLRREAEAEKVRAAAMEARASELELAAAEYKKKTEYLERSLEVSRNVENKQEGEIRAAGKRTSDARDRVRRARTADVGDGTADELCRRLAAAGHPCGE